MDVNKVNQLKVRTFGGLGCLNCESRFLTLTPPLHFSFFSCYLLSEDLTSLASHSLYLKKEGLQPAIVYSIALDIGSFCLDQIGP